MRRVFFFAIAIFAAGGVASVVACRSEMPPMNASAPVSSSVAAQDAVGLWRISAQDPAQSCLLALNLNAAHDGYGVVLEDCRLPDLSKARSWRPTSRGLALHDENGAILLALHRQTTDLYEARPAYRMERAPLA